MTIDTSSDPRNESGWRLYVLLALFDEREDTWLGDLIRAAREGYERCNDEDDAWDEFDRLWRRHDSAGRQAACDGDMHSRLIGDVAIETASPEATPVSLEERLKEVERERDEAIRERDVLLVANVTPEDDKRPLGKSVAYWQEKALDYATQADRMTRRAIYAEAAADPGQRAMRTLLRSLEARHKPEPDDAFTRGWHAVLGEIEEWIDARSPEAAEADENLRR